ncbi:MAG: helix-turn-helix domain-containing protein [Lachnospiraceae bacterium]
MDSIGNRLFELRKKQGITQEKLAEQLNVSRQSVSNWELDKSLPDTDKLFVLAQIYDVSLDYIAYGNAIDKMQEQVHEKSSITGTESDISQNKEWNDTKKAEGIKRLLLAAGIVCTLVLIPVLLFFGHIMTHLSEKDGDMNSNLAIVDRILDQYSYVEVTKLDSEGNFTKDRVWLDTRNLSEGDYIFTYTKPGEPKKLKFEYYTKTMMIPFILFISLLFLDVMIFISFIKLQGKKPENKPLQV